MGNVSTEHLGVNRFWRFWELSTAGATTKTVVPKLTAGVTVANQAPGLAQSPVAAGTGTLARKWRIVITDYSIVLANGAAAGTTSVTLRTTTGTNPIAKLTVVSSATQSANAWCGEAGVCIPLAADDGIDFVPSGFIASSIADVRIGGYYAPCGTDDTTNAAGLPLADKYTGIP